MNFPLHSLLLIPLLLSHFLIAAPLGNIPEIEEDKVRLIFSARSDLWLSPYEDKETPLRIYGATLRLPVTLTEGWIGSAMLATESVSLGRTDVIVGEDTVPLNSNLQDQSAGLGLTHQLHDESSISIYGAFSSASDEPFQNDRDRWMELTAAYRSQTWGDWQGLFAVNYSKNRGFLNNQVIPFLGVSYQPKSAFRFLLGFPYLQMVWKPDLNWTTTASLTPVGGRVKANYIYSDSLLLFLDAGLSARSYLHVNRTQNDHRLIFEEKYAEIGFKRILSPKTYVGFAAGGSFDRNVYEAKTVFRPMGSKIELNGDITGRFLLEFLP